MINIEKAIEEKNEKKKKKKKMADFGSEVQSARTLRKPTQI